MESQEVNGRRHGGADEAKRIAERARADGLGDAPDIAAQKYRQALTLLGESDLTPLHADVLRWHGTLLRERGRTTEAEPLFQRSLDVARTLAYDAGVAHALNCLAGLAQRRGDLAGSENLLTDAATLADRGGNARLQTMIRANLGILADIRGDTVAAITRCLSSLQAAETIRDEQQIAWTLINLGVLHGKEERFDDAERAFTRGLSIVRSRGDVLSEGVVEENRAEMRLMRGELDDAYPSIGRALEVAEQRRDGVRLAAALKLRGAYERMSGRGGEAANTLRHALTLAAVGEDALLGAEILYQFALALHEADDPPMAQEVWSAALEAFERIAARDWVGRVQRRLFAGPTGRYL